MNRHYALPELRLKAFLCGIKYTSSWKKVDFMVHLDAHDLGGHPIAGLDVFIREARAKRLEFKCGQAFLVSLYYNTVDSVVSSSDDAVNKVAHARTKRTTVRCGGLARTATWDDLVCDFGSPPPSGKSEAAPVKKEENADCGSAFCCPICLEPFRKQNIFQCSEGHVLCEQCRIGMTGASCPTCRRPLAGRNRALEEVLQAIATDG